VPDVPQRIVSLVPSVTETLFAMGLEERIVGVTNFCDFPAQARSKPQLGDYAAPSLEAVLLQHPDLVFISADSASPALLAKMERLGLTVYVVYPKGLKETIAMFRALGQVTGAPRAGEELARQLEDSLASIRALVADRPAPRVLFCVMVQPLTVAGPETLVGDLIKAAGGENIVPTGLNRYPTWSDEALLVADPELIVVSPHPGTPNPLDLFAGWTELSAVKNKRIISIHPDWVHRPGPRLPLGLTALAEALHGLKLTETAAEP
jgi:iron complex transport system substrate-binding protein